MSIPVIVYVSAVSHIGPISLGIAKFKRLDRPMKIFLSLCILIFIQVIIEMLLSFQRINNLELTNIGNLIETGGICLVYFVALEKKSYRALTAGLIVLYFAAVAVLGYHYHIPDTIDPWTATAGKVTIITAGLVYLYHEFSTRTTPIAQSPMFWFAVGSLVYNVGTIVLYAFIAELTRSGDDVLIMALYMNFVFIIVANCIYVKGFMCTTL